MTDFIHENNTFNAGTFNASFGPQAAQFRKLRDSLAKSAEKALWKIIQVSDTPVMHLLPLPLDMIPDVLRNHGKGRNYLAVKPITDALVELMLNCQSETALLQRAKLMGRFYGHTGPRAYTILTPRTSRIYDEIILTGNMPVVYQKHDGRDDRFFVVLNQRGLHALEDNFHLWCRPDFEQALKLGVEVARICHAARAPGQYKVPGGAVRLPRGFDVIAGLLGNA